MYKRMAIVLSSVIIIVFTIVWFRFLSVPIIVGEPVVVVFVDAEPNILATQNHIITGSAKLRRVIVPETVEIEILFKDTNYLNEISDSIVGVYYKQQIFKSQIIETTENGAAVIVVEGIPKKTVQEIIQAINR